jgi:hypothetical protein
LSWQWVFGRGVPALAATLLFLAPGVARATSTFLSPLNISAAGQDAFEPKVAVDGSGNTIAVWTRWDGANLRIQSANRTSAGAWSTAQTLSDAGRDASTPDVAFDVSGNALAVWTRTNGVNRRIEAAFRPAGGAFGSPVAVSASGGDADEPTLSFDQAGKAIVVWDRWDGTALRVQAAVRSAGAAGTFGAVQTLSDAGRDAFEPRVAAGPAADANGVAVWTRSDGTNLRVQSARRSDVVGFPRPRGASPTRVALVVAYNACGSPNRSHGAPLSSGSCAPPVQSSSVLTVGTPDVAGNGFGTNFIGSATYRVIPGDANTDADEADVELKAQMTDVRNKPSGSDYVGRVLVSTSLQITDNGNSSETPAPGTVQSIPYEFPVDCVATGAPGDLSIGSTCSAVSRADALVPGTVTEGRRSIWALGQVSVKDAGPNGTGYAACPPTCGDGDETVFLREGVYVP